MSRLLRACSLLALTALAACSSPWNDPYPASQREANIFYASFPERPKHLDPVQAYSENEYLLIGSIYTPPLQYHYLKRPYELVPYAGTEMPQVTYYDASDRALPETADGKAISALTTGRKASANAVPREVARALSHDLRTPLSAMAGWLHLMETGKLDEAGFKRAIEKLRSNIDDQVRTIERHLGATQEGSRRHDHQDHQ